MDSTNCVHGGSRHPSKNDAVRRHFFDETLNTSWNSQVEPLAIILTIKHAKKVM